MSWRLADANEPKCETLSPGCGEAGLFGKDSRSLYSMSGSSSTSSMDVNRAGPSLCPRRVVGEEEMADGSVAKVLPKDLGERLLLRRSSFWRCMASWLGLRFSSRCPCRVLCGPGMSMWFHNHACPLVNRRENDIYLRFFPRAAWPASVGREFAMEEAAARIESM